jgi:hypothetical protein
MMGERPRLFTWNWRAALAAGVADVTLVRISVGWPRWRGARTSGIPYIEELAPCGLLHLDSGPEFERLYRAQLDDVGVPRLEQRFREVAENGLPLALLCFERERSTCHRGVFSAWWQERTGEAVPEWEATGG